MLDLETALSSGNLAVLLWTAGGLAFLHTVLGPDHYVPFVMMAKAQHWSRPKTLVVTLACGLGHVGSSVAIGTTLAIMGTAWSAWADTAWGSSFHGARSGLAAWLLIGLGTGFLIGGTIRALRGRTHVHPHTHDGIPVHTHQHGHASDHMHVHPSKAGRITPWLLFAIFIFGPCESLIPLMLAAWAVAGPSGMVLVASVFSVVTILTILGTVSLAMVGLSHVPMGKLDRWSQSLAGISLVLCGVAIQWLGL